jgi:hypothetical protein
MTLLEMIDLNHPWQPDFARGVLGAMFFVSQPCQVLGFKPCDPGIDGRPGPLQKAAHTELVPALIGEFDDVESRVIAIRIGMVGP